MAAPQKFILTTPLNFHTPEYVRGVVKTAGFTQQTNPNSQGTQTFEIWSQSDGKAGFWIVRMGSVAHAAHAAATTTPHAPAGDGQHYHKNWVADAGALRRYIQQSFNDAWVYNDGGFLIGMHEAGKLPAVQKSK